MRRFKAKFHHPYHQSMQWYRGSIRLCSFLTLAGVRGWEGYAETLRHQIEWAIASGEKSNDAGWKIVNQTPLTGGLLYRR